MTETIQIEKAKHEHDWEIRDCFHGVNPYQDEMSLAWWYCPECNSETWTIFETMGVDNIS